MLQQSISKVSRLLASRPPVNVAGAHLIELVILQRTRAIASPPERRPKSSSRSDKSTFGTDEPLRLNIGDGPGEFSHRALNPAFYDAVPA